jgi:hypothetical protein
VHRLLFEQQQDRGADVAAWGSATSPAAAAPLVVPAAGCCVFASSASPPWVVAVTSLVTALLDGFQQILLRIVLTVTLTIHR